MLFPYLNILSCEMTCIVKEGRGGGGGGGGGWREDKRV